MRWTRALIPTTKETPSDAEVASHKLMIRAGLIRKLSSGTYTYLPLGMRSLLKVVNIVREEMDAAGAQEILMPAVQPIELWRQTGRDVDYGRGGGHQRRGPRDPLLQGAPHQPLPDQLQVPR